MTQSTLTETEALAKILGENTSPQVIGHDGKNFLVASQNAKVHDLKALVAPYQERPDRRKGVYHLSRTQSLIDFANRYKAEESYIKASGKVDGNSVEANAVVVFNPHPAGSDHNLAGHEDFKAVYNFPVSKELTSWLDANAKGMAQAEFAAFIEDHIIDMIDPQFHELERDLEKVLSGHGADPITMLELSRGLEVRVNEHVKNQGRLQSGEQVLTFSVEHAGTDGQPLHIPSWFIINVPVFEGDAPHNIPVRLRYRVKEGRVTWFYELFRMERVFDTAFNTAVDRIQQETDLPVFMVA